MNQQKINTKNAQETQAFARELGASMKGGEVLLLYGNLGAGKTTFMQGLAKGMGIESRITSPTFIIVRKYDKTLSSRPSLPNEWRDLSQQSMVNEISGQVSDTQMGAGNDIKSLYHIDLYRTESDADLEGIGIREILEDTDAVVAIEWPEKLGKFLPEKRIDIRFYPTGEEERDIEITYVE